MATESKAVDLFYVLPKECIASVLSFTSPQDACRSSSVSTNFRSAADSSSFCFSSKKELYLRLCDHPLLLDEGRKSFWLEKRSGKICYMLSPKDLVIVWMETSKYWRWTSLPDARFPEVAELMGVCWLEICGKMNTCMLSPSTLYTAYLVFKVSTGSYGFEDQPVEVAVGVVGSEGPKRKIRSVYLDPGRSGRRRLRIHKIVPRRVRHFNRTRLLYQPAGPRSREKEDGECPKKRGDGWWEIELGEFFNGGEDDGGEVEMSVLEVEGGNWKGGLIVQGIEIRPKSEPC